MDPDGRVHVLCTGTYGTGPEDEAGSVHVVDRASFAVVDTVDLGDAPGRFALDDDGVVWVAGFSGGVRRYVASSLEILPDPTDPALTSSGLSGVAVDAATGTVFVAHFDRDLLLAIDAASVGLREAWLAGDGPVDVLVLRPDQRGAPKGQTE